MERRETRGRREGVIRMRSVILTEAATPAPPLGWREQTYPQGLPLSLFCHAGPPALHCFLFKKGHKPLWVESVIQLVQGAFLGCLGRLGHVVEIQLQGACGREGSFGRRFLYHCQPRLPWAWTGSRNTHCTSSASIHGLSHGSNPPNAPSAHPLPYLLYELPTHLFIHMPINLPLPSHLNSASHMHNYPSHCVIQTCSFNHCLHPSIF